MKGIQMENNMIEYALLEHQAEAVKNNIKNYESHNVTGSVTPTGSGKTFIALAHMITINNPAYTGIDKDGIIRVPLMENGAVNNSKILYVAPTNEIAEQIKIDIVKYICKVDLDKKREQLIEEQIEKNGNSITKSQREKIEKNINKIIIAERDKLVKRAFPNLEFKCYKTLAEGIKNHNKIGETNYDPYLDEPDLVILDEVHRSGAKTFQEGTAALLGCKVENGEVVIDNNAIPAKQNIKVLCLSATPERDVDSRDMTKVWAKALGNYTEAELADDVRTDLGIKMTLPDAINKGILREPNIIHFDCNLGETQEYQILLKIEKDDNIDMRIRGEARKAIEKINREVIGIENYDKMSDKEKELAREEKEIEILTQAINDGLLNIHGKFILFAPKDTKKNNPDGVSPFLPYHTQKTERILIEALKRSNKNNDVVIDYISSSNNDQENKLVLNKFEAKDVTKGPLYIVVAQEKFNEGVHAKNISGGFNTRLITEQENTTLRAQSILFLQQTGRFLAALFPGKKIPPVPTIFDRCNNFYIQNVNGAIDPSQRISIFELTETQKILHDSYLKIIQKLPERTDITIQLPKLLQVVNILYEYGIAINYENIGNTTKLSDLLERQEYSQYKDEILQRLDYLGIIQKNAKSKKKRDYKIGANLKKARKSFWSGAKLFGEYSMDELISSGIIDKTSPEYQKYAVDKKYVQDDFIVMGVSKEFINKNVTTGSYFNEEGKDINGLTCNQFDPETGLDEHNYDRKGFHAITGMHKDTGTIHDTRGFMANGKNILTDSEYDLLDYNIDGIKPFKNEKKEIVGGFDKEHYFHTYDSSSGTFSKIRSGLYAPYKKGVKIDDFGFVSNRKKFNIYTKKEFTPRYFMNNGINHYTSTRQDRLGYDMEGFDINGFNINNINKFTGTRFDLHRKTADYYNSKSIDVRVTLANNNIIAKTFKIQNGKILNTSTGKPISHVKGFAGNGINLATGEYVDIYGFTLLDYYPSGKRRNRGMQNRYGFYSDEVDNIGISAPISPKAKNSVYKYYGSKKVPTNILGTDKSGHMVHSSFGKTNTLHPSLTVTADYIKNCIQNDMSTKTFCEKYAIKNKMLYEEARRTLLTSLNQAVTLYRICPDLAKSQEVQDIMKILYMSSPERVEKFFDKIIDGKKALKKDVYELRVKIKNLDNRISKESLLEKKKSLKRTQYALQKRLESIQNLPNFDNEER